MEPDAAMPRSLVANFEVGGSEGPPAAAQPIAKSRAGEKTGHVQRRENIASPVPLGRRGPGGCGWHPICSSFDWPRNVGKGRAPLKDPIVDSTAHPRVRIGVAFGALLAFGWLLYGGRLAEPGAVSPAEGLGLLGLPLALAVAGLLGSAWWGRWLPLAGALAVLPWATAFLIGPSYGASRLGPLVAGVAGVALLAALTGPTMFRRFEGRTPEWRGRPMTVVRWAIVTNLASMLVLLAFVAAYDARARGPIMLLGGLLALLTVGVLLLARRRTVGLLLVAISCLAFLPAGGWFVAREAASAGEAVLFAVATLPGVLAGIATLIVFRRGLFHLLAGPPA
jgi:hypothetical protein